MGKSHSHHNHPSHVYNFMNKHTAFAILFIIVGCFFAGYFVGKHSPLDHKYEDRWEKGNYMIGGYKYSSYE